MIPVFLTSSALEIFLVLVAGAIFLTMIIAAVAAPGLVRGGVVLRYPSDADGRAIAGEKIPTARGRSSDGARLGSFGRPVLLR